MKNKIYWIIGAVLIVLILKQTGLFAGFNPSDPGTRGVIQHVGTSTVLKDYTFILGAPSRPLDIPIYGPNLICKTNSCGGIETRNIFEGGITCPIYQYTIEKDVGNAGYMNCNSCQDGWTYFWPYSSAVSSCESLGGSLSYRCLGSHGSCIYLCSYSSECGGIEREILQTHFYSCGYTLTVKYKGNEIFKANYGNVMYGGKWYFKNGQISNSLIQDYDFYWESGGYDVLNEVCSNQAGGIVLGLPTISYSVSDIYETAEGKFINFTINQDKFDYFGILNTSFTIKTSLGDVTQNNIQSVNVNKGSNNYIVPLPNATETIIVHPSLYIQIHGSDVGTNLGRYLAFVDISTLDILIGTLDFGEFEAGTVIEEGETTIVVEQPPTTYYEPTRVSPITATTITTEDEEGLSKNMVALILAGLAGLYIITKPKTKK